MKLTIRLATLSQSKCRAFSHTCIMNAQTSAQINNCGTCFKNALLPCMLGSWHIIRRFWQTGERGTGEVLIEISRFPPEFWISDAFGPLRSILGTFRQISQRVKNNFKQNKIHLCEVQSLRFQRQRHRQQELEMWASKIMAHPRCNNLKHSPVR